MIKTIISFFILGLSLGAGPCVASCGPILISYIAATKKNVSRAIWDYCLFSLARLSAYVVLGILFFLLGRFLAERFIGYLYKFVLIGGGIFITIIGISIILEKKIEFFHWQNLHKKNIFILGLIIGILPCAPLLAIFSYIGLVSKSWILSLFSSLAFGIGTFFSPLLLFVLLTGLIPHFLTEKKAAFYRVFSSICGIIIILLGLDLIRRAF